MTVTIDPPLDRHAPPRRSPRPDRLAALARGRDTDPRWVRPALAGLLAATAVLYLWGLGASGYANSFYAAAVQAGTKSWTAFFFGSSDAANFITVDKPPAALWMMEIPARLFGVNAWTLLVPQALEGVAAVGVLYAAVRRWFSPGAALLSGAVLALTPVAALMFRFNNPDALLTLALTGAAYATIRALERARTGWLVLAATLVGFGFITKMMQAFLVVPVFAAVYLLAAPAPLRRRVRQLLMAGVALVVSAGWWVAAVQLTPAADRPYIGGSAHNSLLELIFGYNGLGRLTGNESGSVGGGPAGTGNRWGATGWNRLFGPEMGSQIGWLVPAALVLLVACLWVRGRAARTDRVRAALLLWGGWLLLTGAVFSFAQGIIHPYYTLALAPAVAALAGTGAATLWQLRARLLPRAVLAATLVGTAGWAWVLLDRTPDWYPALRTVVVVVAVAAAGALLALPRLSGRAVPAVVAGGLAAALAGPSAYAMQTASTPHTGAIPAAGPAVAGGFGGRPAGFGRIAGGGPAGAGGQPQLPPGFRPGGAPGRGRMPGGVPGGAGGGLLNGSNPAPALVAVVNQDSGRYTWVAAAVGSNTAAGYQLATGRPVMAIGGFNGSDPAPTLAQFQEYVRGGRIHFFIGGGGFGGGGFGGGSADTDASQITAWVTANFSARTVGGVTIYDLTAPRQGRWGRNERVSRDRRPAGPASGPVSRPARRAG